MGERRLAPLAALAGLVCCVGTAIAAVALGGVALASLSRFGVISATMLWNSNRACNVPCEISG